MLTFERLSTYQKIKLLKFGLIVKTCPFEFSPYMITRQHLKTRMRDLKTPIKKKMVLSSDEDVDYCNHVMPTIFNHTYIFRF